MAEFKIPPLSTLIGSNWVNFIKTLRGNKIEPKFYMRIFLSGLFIILLTPFRIYENIKFKSIINNFQFRQDPVFIVGHWRSGTTLLHNLLCKSQNAGFLTTYFSVFPNYLSSKWLLKPFMEKKMPKKRPSDNIKLKPEAPQEDEFALGNFIPYIYYNFWLFPKRYKEFYSKYVRFSNSPEIKEAFIKNYRKLLAKALIDTNGSRAFIKNPVNTSRIPVLLEMFPNAKFIYIYRNPITVYLSSLKFFNEVFSSVCLQEITPEQIKKIFLETYIKLFNDYEREKHLIPAGNLVEIRFEDLEENPIKTLEHIYDGLRLENFDSDKRCFQEYLKSVKNYKKNNYSISEEELKLIRDNWGFAIEKYGYSIPKSSNVNQKSQQNS